MQIFLFIFPDPGSEANKKLTRNRENWHYLLRLVSLLRNLNPDQGGKNTDPDQETKKMTRIRGSGHYLPVYAMVFFVPAPDLGSGSRSLKKIQIRIKRPTKITRIRES